MLDASVIILALLALNVFQLVFWSFQVQKMTNKIMSRSYFDYEMVKTPEKPRGFAVQVPSDEELSMPDQTRIMDELLTRQI